MEKVIRLLYAEDNQQDAELTRTFFSNEAPEFKIDIASTGKEFLKLIQEKTYDIFLLDHRLPDQDGIEVLKQMIKLELFLPVVIVTGVGDEELVVETLRLGASDYIPKHRNYLQTLPALLKSVLEEHPKKKIVNQRVQIGKRQIMYVEYNQMDIDLTVRHFADAAPNFKFKIVQSSEKALELLKKKHTFDLVLSDLRMPDMSALDLMRNLKHSGINVPVIVITGKGDENAAIATLRFGASDYIVKRDGYLIQLPFAIENAITSYHLGRVNQKLLEDLQKAVEESKESFMRVTENIHDALVIDDREGQVLLANSRFFEMFGFSREELHDIKLEDYVAPEWREKVRKHHNQQLQSKSAPARYEYEGLHKDGSRKWLEVTVSKILKNEQIIGTQTIFRDITKRKIVEEAMRISRDRYERAVEAGKVGVWEWHFETNEMYIDPRLKELLGFADHEIENNLNDWGKRVHPDDAEQVMQQAQAHIDGLADRYEVEHRMLHKDGSERWFLAHGLVSRNTEGKAYRMIGTDTDITERKKTENKLAESESRFRSLFDDAPIIIWEEDFSEVKFAIDSLRSEGVKDFRTYFESHPHEIKRLAKQIKIVDVNKKSIDFYEAESKEKLVSHLPSYFTEESWQVFHEEIIALSEGETKFESEISISTPRGDLRSLIVNLTIPPAFEENWKRVLVSFVDITDRKKTEEQLRLSITQIERFSEHLNNAIEEDRKRISRDLHDELGQSLSLIQVELDLLNKEISKSVLVDKKINSITNLVEITIEKIQEISKDLRPSMLDNFGFVTTVEWLMESTIKKSGLDYNFQVTPQDISISQELSITLFRIIQECLTNVIRHAKASKVNVVLTKSGNAMELIIEDDGRGITNKEINNLNSIGIIGMSERARYLNGKIEIKGKAKKGTTVKVKIPY